MTNADSMYIAIEEHGRKLDTIFNTGLGNIELCKKLRQLEVKASRFTTRACNTGEDVDAELDKILAKVHEVLKITDDGLSDEVFINRDPRGYALKIDDDYMRCAGFDLHQDFGGYGILAPDYSDGGVS